MRFAYMDEAGNTGRNLTDPSQTVHMILTVVVDESDVTALHDHMRAVGEKHCSPSCYTPDFEFHGHSLFAGSDHFAGMPPAKRIEIYEDVLRCIELVDAQLVLHGVSKPNLHARYDHPFHPHDIALMFTIESVERMTKKHGARVLLVADEAREIEDSALRDLASYQQLGTTWGWNTEQIDHIIDTIHFVRSETNPGIQLADCATFIAARQRKIDRGQVAPNSAVTQMWEKQILPYMWRNSVWLSASPVTPHLPTPAEGAGPKSAD